MSLKTTSTPIEAGRNPNGDQRVARKAIVDVAGGFNQATSVFNSLENITQGSVDDTAAEITLAAVGAVDTAVNSTQGIDTLSETGVPTREEAASIQRLKEEGIAAVGEDSFAAIAAAERNNTLTPTAAMLHTQQQVTDRIQQHPLFSDRIRRASEKILGISEQSNRVRAILGGIASPTQKATALSAEQKLLNQIDQRSSYLEIPIEQGRRAYFHSQDVARRADEAADNLALGKIDFSEGANSLLKKETTGMGQQIQEHFASSETPPSSVAIKGVIEQKRVAFQQAMYNLKGSENNRDEVATALADFDKAAERVQAFADSVGIENLTAARIARFDAEGQLWGYENLGKTKVIKDFMGEGVNKTLAEVFLKFGDDPKKFNAHLENFPEAKKAYELISNGEPISKRTTIAYGKFKLKTLEDISEGKKLTEAQRLIVPSIMQELGTNPDGTSNPAGTDKLSELFGDDMPLATTSMVLKGTPRDADDSTKKRMKANFLGQLKGSVDKFAEWVAIAPAQRTYRFRKDGSIQPVDKGRSFSGSGWAHAGAEEVNMYAHSLKRGWGDVLGTDKEKLQKAITERIDSTLIEKANAIRINTLNEISYKLQSGEPVEAEKAYNEFAATSREAGVIVRPFSQVKIGLRNNSNIEDLSLVEAQDLSQAGTGALKQAPSILDILEAAPAKAGSGVFSVDAQAMYDRGWDDAKVQKGLKKLEAMQKGGGK